MSKSELSATDAADAVKAFDLDDPHLPREIDDAALTSGAFPYQAKLGRQTYKKELERLQIELIKLQASLQKRGERLVVLFEGRDAAGKGTSIKRFMAHLNPRRARAVALNKPTEVEAGQWYFQRYVPHLPAAGDIVLFDRSWYNRAGVEKVMGFCSAEQLADFLREAPQFEAMLTRDGIHLFKFYLDIGRQMQLKRFHRRRHDPLRRWKITEVDLAAITKWDDYTKAKEDMFRFTHTAASPWTVICANDKRRTRLEAIRSVLYALDYEGKQEPVVGKPDVNIVGSRPELLYGTRQG
jgi:polyphosphate kinase 2